MQFIKLGDQVMHYRMRGEGAQTTLVFANSLGTDLRLWDRLAPAFDGNFCVLCYDKRGHGLSSAPPPPYSLADHRDDLINLLDALGIADIVLCGDSVGGLIVQAIAERQPDRVKALVLCDTAARIGDEATWNSRIEAARNGGVEALADATMERWFSEAFRRRNTDEIQIWRNMLVRTPLDGFIGTMMALRDADQTAATGAFDLPALVVVGSEDGSTPPAVVRELANLIDNSEFHVIAEAGHLPCVDQPGKLQEVMTGFFRKHQLM
ncbi:MAG: 3-oxoadipate enol-lactonase [marine bacterium B5-7]|nr:MAG: 3-oxoadipate enol-lactonase [marine bacterium B5-7]